MRKSRSFINSSPSREGDPWFASPSQRPTLSPPSPPPSEGRKEKRKKGTREGEETSSFDNPLLSHLVNARCAKKFSLWESHQNSIPPPLPRFLYGILSDRGFCFSPRRGEIFRAILIPVDWFDRSQGARALSLSFLLREIFDESWLFSRDFGNFPSLLLFLLRIRQTTSFSFLFSHKWTLIFKFNSCQDLKNLKIDSLDF